MKFACLRGMMKNVLILLFLVFLITEIKPEGNCKEIGEIQRADYCYFFNEDLKTFKEASQECQEWKDEMTKKSCSLATHTEEEINYILESFPKNNTWIGLSKGFNSSIARWEDNTTFIEEEFINITSALNQEEEVCFYITESRKIEARNCSDRLPFICKSFIPTCFNVFGNSSTTCNSNGLCIDTNVCSCDASHSLAVDCAYGTPDFLKLGVNILICIMAPVIKLPQIINFLVGKTTIGVSFMTLFFQFSSFYINSANSAILNSPELLDFCKDVRCANTFLSVLTLTLSFLSSFVTLLLYLFYFGKDFKKKLKDEKNDLVEDANLKEEKVNKPLSMSDSNEVEMKKISQEKKEEEKENEEEHSKEQEIKKEENKDQENKEEEEKESNIEDENKEKKEEVLENANPKSEQEQKDENKMDKNKNYNPKNKKRTKIVAHFVYIWILVIGSFVLFVVPLAIISTILIIFFRGTEGGKLFAQIIGYASVVLVMIRWLPQIFITITSCSSGNFSKLSLFLGIPGNLVFLVTLIINLQDFSTLIMILTSTIFMCIELTLLIVFDVKDCILKNKKSKKSKINA